VPSLRHKIVQVLVLLRTSANDAAAVIF